MSTSSTTKELFRSRFSEKPLLPPLRENWKSYSILALMLAGGTLMPISSIAGSIALLVGTGMSVYETKKSSDL